MVAKFRLTAFLIFSLSNFGLNAASAPDIITVRSYSGQFTAREARHLNPWSPVPHASQLPIAGSLAFIVTAPPLAPTTKAGALPLEPSLLVVTCERVKSLFLLELDIRDDWRGRINLIINPNRLAEWGPALTATHHSMGWSYDLELPKIMEPKDLVRALVQVLSTEYANRGAGSHSAEIPFWLVAGLSAHLQAYNVPTFILRPNLQSVGYARMGIAGMDSVRAGLRQQTPLTFQELCWPEKTDVTGTDEERYRSCALLFFDGLMQMKGGAACMRKLLGELPRHMNWQTAFLQGFNSHFSQLLEVEKWWGLTCVSFTSADLTEPQTELDCWRKFQQALDVPVEVHFDSARVPAQARMTLQEIVLQWEPQEALPVIDRAQHELAGLQVVTYRCDLNLNASVANPGAAGNVHAWAAVQKRVSQNLSPLIAAYRALLLGFLKQCHYDAREAALGKKLHESQSAKNDLVRQLNDLDRQRSALRAEFKSAERLSALSVANAAKPAPAQ